MQKEMKNTKIALLSGPVWTIATPPLNISYIKSFLLQHNFQARCFDLNIELFHAINPSKRKFWDSPFYHYWHNEKLYKENIEPQIKQHLPKLLEKVIAYKPDIIGISVYSPRFIKTIAPLIKKLMPQTKLVLGGQMCSTSMQHFYLRSIKEVDIIVEGEGEIAMKDIAEAHENNSDIQKCPGTIEKKHNKIYYHGDVERIKDIDSIPFPNYDDYNISKYYDDYEMKKPAQALPILFARGCCNRCDFCLQRQIWKNKYFCRKGENVFKEMMHNYDTYGISKFVFADLLVNGNIKELEILCDKIIEQGLPALWWGSAVVKPQMSLELFKKMKRAGCHTLSIGLESASNKVLKSMNKPYTKQMAEEFIKKAHEGGIRITTNIILGHPSENDIDFFETVIFLRDMKDFLADKPWPTLCAIIPGTDLYDKCINDKNFRYGDKNNYSVWTYKSNTTEKRKKKAELFEKFCKKEYGDFEILKSFD